MMMMQRQQANGDGCVTWWTDMVPDALVNIFSRLSLEERLCIVPSVCRSWRRISQEPACWQKVDLEEWYYGTTLENLHRMAELLVNKAHGRITHFCVPHLESAHMLLASSTRLSASALQVLQITHNALSEDTLCDLASKFSLISYLDISYCAALSKCSVEAFGKSCAQITHLILNMSPNNVEPNDDIAFAVSKYMQKVEHLEMVYGTLSNIGLKALVENCKSLEYLDLRGCWSVNMKDTYLKEASKRLKVFYGPEVKDTIYDQDMDASDYSDNYDDLSINSLIDFQEENSFADDDVENEEELESFWEENSEDGSIW